MKDEDSNIKQRFQPSRKVRKKAGNPRSFRTVLTAPANYTQGIDVFISPPFRPLLPLNSAGGAACPKATALIPKRLVPSFLQPSCAYA
jgi:hypothetical protein